MFSVAAAVAAVVTVLLIIGVRQEKRRERLRAIDRLDAELRETGWEVRDGAIHIDPRKYREAEAITRAEDAAHEERVRERKAAYDRSVNPLKGASDPNYTERR